MPNVVERSINLVISVCLVSSLIVCLSYAIRYVVFDGLDLTLGMPDLDPMSLFDGIIYELMRGVFWSIGINGHVILAPYKIELFRMTSESLVLIEAGIGTMPILTSNFYDFYTGMGARGTRLAWCYVFYYLRKIKDIELSQKPHYFLVFLILMNPFCMDYRLCLIQ